jgi:uncharacterized OB-fold protein
MVDYLVINDGEPHLLSNECSSCGALYFDRRNACAKCGKQGPFNKRKLGGKGTVRSFTIVKRGAPGVPPFVSSVIDLEGGGFVKANLVDIEPDPAKITLGMAVKLKTFVAGKDDDGTEAVVFGFTPA